MYICVYPHNINSVHKFKTYRFSPRTADQVLSIFTMLRLHHQFNNATPILSQSLPYLILIQRSNGAVPCEKVNAALLKEISGFLGEVHAQQFQFIPVKEMGINQLVIKSTHRNSQVTSGLFSSRVSV